MNLKSKIKGAPWKVGIFLLICYLLHFFTFLISFCEEFHFPAHGFRYSGFQADEESEEVREHPDRRNPLVAICK